MPLVKKYQGLRVTDVLDAMQAVGLQDRGLMDKTIRPLWRDNTDKVAHRFYGIAITYQYLPTNKAAAGKMPYDEFKKWHSYWYRTYAPETFAQLIKPGHAVVIDSQGIENTGFIGSNNTLNWFSRGMTRHGIIVVSGGSPFPKILNRGGTIVAENCQFYGGVRLEVFKGASLEIGNGTYLNRNTVVIAVGSVKIGAVAPRFGPNR